MPLTSSNGRSRGWAAYSNCSRRVTDQTINPRIMNDDLPEGWSLASVRELAVHSLGGDWGKARNEAKTHTQPCSVIRGTEYRTWERSRASGAAERYLKPASLERRRLKEGDLIIEVSGGGPN